MRTKLRQRFCSHWKDILSNTRAIKNPIPLLLIFALFLVILFTFLITSKDNTEFPYSSQENYTPSCTDGDLKNCSVGDCNGTSTCMNGKWHGCKWDIICTPGSVEPCTDHSCVYAYKECNECGTGYGPCE